MSMSTIIMIISLIGILAAVVHFLRQPAFEKSVSDTSGAEEDTSADYRREIIMDTVILLVFFTLLLWLGSQIN